MTIRGHSGRATRHRDSTEQGASADGDGSSGGAGLRLFSLAPVCSMSGWIPRIHLFELEDQPWFPTLIRDLATDYLRCVEQRVGLHRHVLPVLTDALRENEAGHVLDLCSGGGGPVISLQRELALAGLSVRFTLSDRFPNLEAFERATELSEGSIDFIPTPLDARSVPLELSGFRTFFNAFHHFAPSDAQSILQDAADAGRPIGVFEIPERSLKMIFGVLFTPLMVWVLTPSIRPFRWSRLLWTYLLPAVPLTCLWDGVVSMFRAYTTNELLALAESTGTSDYEWRAGENRDPSAPGKLTYLVGRPLAARA